jgi:hypothetical protein
MMSVGLHSISGRKRKKRSGKVIIKRYVVIVVSLVSGVTF